MLRGWVAQPRLARILQGTESSGMCKSFSTVAISRVVCGRLNWDSKALRQWRMSWSLELELLERLVGGAENAMELEWEWELSQGSIPKVAWSPSTTLLVLSPPQRDSWQWPVKLSWDFNREPRVIVNPAPALRRWVKMRHVDRQTIGLGRARPRRSGPGLKGSFGVIKIEEG